MNCLTYHHLESVRRIILADRDLYSYCSPEPHVDDSNIVDNDEDDRGENDMYDYNNDEEDHANKSAAIDCAGD